MQKEISTNIHIPEPLWKAIKVRAAEEGRSMKALILDGIALVLGLTRPRAGQQGTRRMLLKFAGKVKVATAHGSTAHDDTIYDR